MTKLEEILSELWDSGYLAEVPFYSSQESDKIQEAEEKAQRKEAVAKCMNQLRELWGLDKKLDIRKEI